MRRSATVPAGNGRRELREGGREAGRRDLRAGGAGRAGGRRALALLLPAAVAAGCSDDPLTPPPSFTTPPPATRIELAPGEFVTLTGDEIVAPMELPDAAETRAYLVVVQDARDRPGEDRPLRVHVRRVPQISTSGAPSGEGLTLGGVTARPPAGDIRPMIDRWYGEEESRFRSAVRRYVSRSATPAAPRPPPVPGQTLEFGSPVDVDGSLATCTSTARVTGVVRAVGPHFAVVEDTAVAGPLTAADYDDLLAELEGAVVPVSEAYFGTPDDIDGNGRVLALVTAAVNRLGAAGFFTPSDLAPAEDCPAGNEGELLWLVAPDPTGEFGEPVSIQVLKDRLPGIVAHELQHLVHAQRRVAEGGGDLTSVDEPWLNEGLSHIGEEVTGFFVAGRGTGEDLELADLATLEGSLRFRRYHLADFRFVRDYLRSTERVPAVVDEAVTTVDFRRARGFGYLFLRWLADRFAAGGPPGLVGSAREQELFRSLVVGGPGLARSTDNVVASLSTVLGVERSWDRLFAEYAAVPAVDDVAEPGIPLAPALRLSTWNLPAAYENARLNGFDLDFPEGYPLAPRLLLLGSLPDQGFAVDVELRPSTATYFQLEAARETPLTRISVLGPDGAPVTGPGGLQVTIVRTF